MGEVKMSNSDALRLAGRVADTLIESAIVVRDQATWLAPAVEWADGGYQAVERTGDPVLYDGSAGIALACVSVAESLQRDDLLEIAVLAARHAVSRSQDVDRLGLYDGQAGIGLAALIVGRRAMAGDLEAAGARLIESLRFARTAQSDLIGGTAGLALAFLRAAGSGDGRGRTRREEGSADWRMDRLGLHGSSQKWLGQAINRICSTLPSRQQGNTSAAGLIHARIVGPI
jgi:lantibiotic modifying enzyme